MELNDITFRRRHPITLQLAPIIDIFTLIIVFLLQSTVVADISIVFPGDLTAPKSKSAESLETLPEVFVFDDRIEIPFLSENRKFSELNQFSDQEIEGFKSKSQKYFSELTDAAKQSAVHINLLAGRDNSYAHVFEAVKFLRRIGFEKVQFIAEGEMK